MAAEALAAPEKQRTSKFSRILSRIFAASRGDGNSSDGKAEQHQLLLPCLLGDPFACLSVNRRVGVAAGTYLGRLSLFYGTDSSATVQLPQQHLFGESQKNEAIKGQVLLPQAYSDDGVAICWVDSSYLTAIMGASDLVQWKLPSLRCMGSEQLSLFAGRSSFNTVAISMRLLRRCEDTKQLQLMYRHCSKALANMILLKMQHPHREASLSMASERAAVAMACPIVAGCSWWMLEGLQDSLRRVRGDAPPSAGLPGISLARPSALQRSERLDSSRETDFATPAAEASLGCLPEIFLRCLQKTSLDHQSLNHALASRRSHFLSRLALGFASRKPRPLEKEVHVGENALSAVVPSPTHARDTEKGLRKNDCLARSNSLGIAGDELLLHTLQDVEKNRGSLRANSSSTHLHHHSPDTTSLKNHYHPFFLFERSPLAFRVAEAFFRFCSLLLQQQRQLLQLSSFNGDAHTPLHGSLKPPPPFTGKPMCRYRQSARLLAVDCTRQDFCFLTLDAAGWLRTFSLFSSRPLQTLRVSKGLFAAGWPYILASDGPLVAYSSDKGVFGCHLDEAALGCSWASGDEAFCMLPLEADTAENGLP
ncbi:hypothetical protein cyc_07425 [Cyclospora cayetanensis]|uniref:Uncharacterized protein n=1 Tax=Cyclospora cayetanensis TaxID=88456 RepID=A0A1D3CYL9_9EIME|nr:hypothetical protein cyc_07425 [Cyclospora cayetanensis]